MTRERDVLRELEAALDVSPSPDFEARVRARVRTQSIGASRWKWPAAVAVAATIALAVILTPSRSSPVRPEIARPKAVPRVAGAPAVTSVAENSRPSVEARPSTAGGRPRRVPAEPSLAPPAVVIPAGQMAAIQRLMSEVSAGRVVIAPERPAPPAALQVSALAEATPIEFDTIRFTPLSADASPDLWR
jgi:hypothetical protein